MKKVILMLIVTTFFFSLNTLKAQHTLSFERSIFIELGGSLPDSISFTVPSGKTWKITSASIHGGSNQFYLNNKMIADNNAWGQCPCPIWLASGTYILQSTGAANAFISGIEFTLTP